ncbi:MAG: AIR synthase related protein [Planctomycetota bacterium]
MSPGTGRFVGDDLASLPTPAGHRLLVGTDPVLDGVHLDVAEAGFAAAGRKAMNRNLSDVAAMGARPVAATLSIVAPLGLTSADARQIVEAAEAAGAVFDCPIVGGDYSAWRDKHGKLAVSVAIIAAADIVVPRVGAQAGDGLFVSGPLGGIIHGRHLTFTPRVALGQRLAGRARVMMDLSDGLGRDLPRLLDGLGAELSLVPVHADARGSVERAIYDGEDYELLVAAEPDIAADFPELIRIGTVTDASGIVLHTDGHRHRITPGGWDHGLRD